MELKVTQKRLDTSPIQHRLTQGESLVDRPKIVMQRDYEGLDISALNYDIRAVSEKGTMVIRTLEKSLEDDQVVLTWTVTKEFTAVDGFLALTIVGIDDTGEEIIKITSDKIIIRPDPDDDWIEPPVDVVQDALNQMAAMQRAAQQAAADAQESANNAADSSDAAAASAEEAKASKNAASTAADSAANAATSAAASRDKAKRYAEMASQIVTGSKGWFPTQDELAEQYPIGEDGWWAIVGTTDTIWVWDSDTGKWQDSGRGSGGGPIDDTDLVKMDGGATIVLEGDFPPVEGGHVIKFTDKIPQASDIGYLNDKSDLEAVTMQEAIDELAEKIADGGEAGETIKIIKQELAAMQTEFKSIRTKLNDTLWVPGAGAHNGIYRGKYLGDHVTEDQFAAISDGTFEDLYIGDYWIINNVTYRIAGFDWYYNCGDTACTTHHIIVVPDASLYTHVMNDTNTTAGGYYGSKMHTSGLDSANATAAGAFGAEHILSHREYLNNAVTNGRPFNGSWYDCTVELMNERMVYGNDHFTPVSDGNTVPLNYTISKGQLPLFFFRHDLIGIRDSYWLRDVINAEKFSRVSWDGNCAYQNAIVDLGVRPAIPVAA